VDRLIVRRSVERTRISIDLRSRSLLEGRLLLATGEAKMRRLPIIVAALVSTEAVAQSPEPIDIAPFVAREVVPNVHLLTTPENYAGPVIGNVILVEQSDGFVVVDSGLNAGNGRAVVRFAKSLSDRPIKAVMITHWHNDHPQGVSAIRDAYPKVRIIATRATEAGMLGPEAFDIGYRPARKWDQAMARLAAKVKGDLQKLLDDPSTEADRKERIRIAIPQYDAALADFRGSYIVPPTETFERQLLIDDPDVPVQILHFGRANTDGDALAWLPKQKILMTGDIVVAPTPFGFGSYPSDWIQTIQKMKAMGFNTLVPGHGPPQTDGLYLDKLIAAISDVRTQVGPLARAGMPLEEVRRKVDFAKSIALFGSTDRIRRNAQGLFFDPMIVNAYHEARGEPIVQGEGGGEPDLPRDTPPKPRSIHHDS
jgi:glyoxylase-like metal-dependent hydrolase (beta-lactamase superfamily II)